MDRREGLRVYHCCAMQAAKNIQLLHRPSQDVLHLRAYGKECMCTYMCIQSQLIVNVPTHQAQNDRQLVPKELTTARLRYFPSGFP